MGSQYVINGFPMCSPRVFPIAPHFNPTCFAQSPPLLTYVGGPKGEALQLAKNRLFWGASIVSTLFCNGPIKLAPKKNKVGLVSHPLTNLSMKEGSLFRFGAMRSTEHGCFRSCYWCLWKALDEERRGAWAWFHKCLDLWYKSS